MKFTTIAISFVLTIMIISCTSNAVKKTENSNPESTDAVKVSYINKKDIKAQELKRKGAVIAKLSTVALGKALQNAIDKGGVEHAIDFCKLNAIKIIDSLSKAEGVIIKRIAKKNRNPENETNPAESKIYKHYCMEWLANKTLESKLAIDDNNHPVFYKPIIINNKCLTCHGKPGETMPANIATKIAEMYPNDKAIDFEDGHPRGMWSITFTSINVKKN